MEIMELPATYQEHKKLEQKILNSEWWGIKERLSEIESSIYIFSRNYAELVEKIRYFSLGESLLLFDERNSKDLDEFLLEILRLLHNFVASSKSLVDQSRIIIAEVYEGKEFLNEYRQKVKNIFEENPQIQIIHELRNYFLHKKIPLVSASVDSNNFNKELSISVSDLLKNWNWKKNKISKDFLKAQTEDLDIKKLIENYAKIVFDFHDWLYEKHHEVNKSAIDEFKNLSSLHSKSRWTIKL